jgi:hypothetical protein
LWGEAAEKEEGTKPSAKSLVDAKEEMDEAMDGHSQEMEGHDVIRKT